MSQHKISYNDKNFGCLDNESLIEAALRQGISFKFSCRRGSCHVCMMQCEQGRVPEKSQTGLRDQYIEKNYFLPCICKPTQDMKISNIPVNELYNSAIVNKKELLSEDICRLIIAPSGPMKYLPGQYINLQRPEDGLSRSYSLVSHPDDYLIEIHIKKMPGAKMSSWIYDELMPDTEVLLQGPIGECTYQKTGNTDSTIILAGVSTGIAPLQGILNDALRHQHTGDIHILHSGIKDSEIYLHQTFKSLCEQHNNLYYSAYVPRSQEQGSQEQGSQNPDITDSTLLEALENKLSCVENPSVYLVGPRSFVDAGANSSMLAGVSIKQIFSDSFDFKDLRSGPPRLQSDPEMWKALEQGEKLKLILDDFYNQVYLDEKLSAFFENTTEKRSREKQYLFMRQIFSGEKIYFGDRPKNAHHWMVISNELFDYREKILTDSMRKYGLAEHLIKRWLEIDESFRQDIVKTMPQAKIINGVAFPLDNFEILKIDEGTLCDNCNGKIEKGETVRYHLRMGFTYCSGCMKSAEIKSAPSGGSSQTP